MPGGMHPPIEVMLSWPIPNYVDPVTRPKAATIFACTLGPLTIFLIFARLWVRMYYQRNAGLDDWLMLLASIPLIALTVLVPLALDVYNCNRHVWDVEIPLFVVQRKYVLAVETTFCVASGLIKVSILLFYKRLGSHAVSRSFQWVTKATIAFIVGFSIAFTLVPIFGCQPISAFWDQRNYVKLAKGYKYKCFNEGADIFAAAIISTIQDFITAILPTFIYWNLQIPKRQKVALFFIFAIGYSVVAFGVMRSYYSWQVFFESYDVTWVVWDCFIWALLELYIGAICANIPASKVFFQMIFRIKTLTTESRSNKYYNPGSKGSTNRPTHASLPASNFSRRSFRKGRDYGKISELSSEWVDISNDATNQPEGTIKLVYAEGRASMDSRSDITEDIELGVFPNRLDPDTLQSRRATPPDEEGAQALPHMPSPYPAAHLRPSTHPSASSSTEELTSQPSSKSWS